LRAVPNAVTGSSEALRTPEPVTEVFTVKRERVLVWLARTPWFWLYIAAVFAWGAPGPLLPFDEFER